MVTEEGMEVGMGGQGVCFDVRKAKHTQIRMQAGTLRLIMTYNVKRSIYSFGFWAGHGQKQPLMVWIYSVFCICNGIKKKHIPNFLSYPCL